MLSRPPENVGEILQGLDRRKQQTTLERALILSFIFFPPSALQTVTFLVAGALPIRTHRTADRKTKNNMITIVLKIP